MCQSCKIYPSRILSPSPLTPKNVNYCILEKKIFLSILVWNTVWYQLISNSLAEVKYSAVLKRSIPFNFSQKSANSNSRSRCRTVSRTSKSKLLKLRSPSVPAQFSKFLNIKQRNRSNHRNFSQPGSRSTSPISDNSRFYFKSQTERSDIKSKLSESGSASNLTWMKGVGDQFANSMATMMESAKVYLANPTDHFENELSLSESSLPYTSTSRYRSRSISPPSKIEKTPIKARSKSCIADMSYLNYLDFLDYWIAPGNGILFNNQEANCKKAFKTFRV